MTLPTIFLRQTTTNTFSSLNSFRKLESAFFRKLFCVFHFNLIEDGGFSVFQRFLKLWPTRVGWPRDPLPPLTTSQIPRGRRWRGVQEGMRGCPPGGSICPPIFHQTEFGLQGKNRIEQLWGYFRFRQTISFSLNSAICKPLIWFSAIQMVDIVSDRNGRLLKPYLNLINSQI